MNIRLVAVLTLLVFGSSLGVVYAKFKSRRMFDEMQWLRKQIQSAETDYGNLQIEYTMLGGRNELERKAMKELDMKYPEPKSIIYIGQHVE
ncbi:MAG: cell division protein FtsL [Gammaproteobacteria bacterium]|nr:cell division protein FtsL [Gammaproteobacteria bacterium]